VANYTSRWASNGGSKRPKITLVLWVTNMSAAISCSRRAQVGQIIEQL
jgi:hypothetical protein